MLNFTELTTEFKKKNVTLWHGGCCLREIKTNYEFSINSYQIFADIEENILRFWSFLE